MEGIKISIEDIIKLNRMKRTSEDTAGIISTVTIKHMAFNAAQVSKWLELQCDTEQCRRELIVNYYLLV